MDYKHLSMSLGFAGFVALGSMEVYKFSKKYASKTCKKYNFREPTHRELMAVGGVTSIVGFALSFLNKSNLKMLMDNRENNIVEKE
jgi:hypothetical protein